jgi:hypothetical protein
MVLKQQKQPGDEVKTTKNGLEKVFLLLQAAFI